MSTDYRPEEDILESELFDGRLAEMGITECTTKDTSLTARCLTDGDNYLWVYMEDSHVSCMTRWGQNNPCKILNSIFTIFDINIFSEHEPQYWGFDTQEEWDQDQEKCHQECAEEFYQKIVHFLRGESHDICPGTVGMEMAEIAKKLVDNDPGLLSADNKSDLMEKMYTLYNEPHQSGVWETDF